MKAVFATVVLSILSAIVAVFSITELCTKSQTSVDSAARGRSSMSDAKPTAPRQKIQQWVNH